MDWDAYYEELYPTNGSSSDDGSTWFEEAKTTVLDQIGDWFNQSDSSSTTTTTTTGVTLDLATVAAALSIVVAIIALRKA